MNGEYDLEGFRQNIGRTSQGMKLPETIPAAVRKIALVTTTMVLPVEGERSRSVKYVTLSNEDVALSGDEEDITVHFPVRKDSETTEEMKAGIVQPAPDEADSVEPILVVLRQPKEQYVAKGKAVDYKAEVENRIAAEFVLDHLDQFPARSLFEDG